MEQGDLFGESFSFSEEEKLTISAVASEKAKILFVDYNRITETCSMPVFFIMR
jgi:hypothetical protein